jgi:tRNA dimethylallyltransferase
MSQILNGAHLKSHIQHLPRHVLVLIGPTASGKTPTSLLIAERINAEIISADSRQVYKLMDIGTAKPSTDDRERVKHYFIDELFPDQDFNAGEYGKKGQVIIDDIFQRGKIPLIVGGSGLYVQALIDGFFEGPSADQTIRQQLTQRVRGEGAEKLLEELRVIDPIAAATMLQSNTRRIIRALEVYELTGTPISESQKSRVIINFSPVFVGLRLDRTKLYELINRRVDLMLERGLVEEVKMLRARGYDSQLNSLQTVGYKEVFDFLQGKTDNARMVELIKQNSRRYAKRQLTWFRRDKRISWFDVAGENDLGRVAEEISDFFLQSGLADFPKGTPLEEPPTLAPKEPRSSRFFLGQ